SIVIGYSASSCVTLATHACTKLALEPLDLTIDAGDGDFLILVRKDRFDVLTMEPLGHYIRRLENGWFGPKIWLKGPGGTFDDQCQFGMRDADIGAMCLDSSTTPKPRLHVWGPDNL